MTTILYAEDDRDDVHFFRSAVKKVTPNVSVAIVPDGDQAVAWLTECLAGGSLPALVLLDLHLPIRSGFDVLTWVRQQGALAALPVVMFSSSGRDEDRALAGALGATDYVVKPPSGAQFTHVLRALDDRWLAEANAAV